MVLLFSIVLWLQCSHLFVVFPPTIILVVSDATLVDAVASYDCGSISIMVALVCLLVFLDPKHSISKPKLCDAEVDPDHEEDEVQEQQPWFKIRVEEWH